MSQQFISMHRRKGKDIQKPTLRRSMDFAYENIVGEVSSFDRDNDPPLFVGGNISSLRSLSTKSVSSSTHAQEEDDGAFDPFFQLSLNTIDFPAAYDYGHGSASALVNKRTVSSDIEEPMNSIGHFNHEQPNLLEVVMIVSSDEKTSAKPASITVVPVTNPDDAEEPGGIASRTNSSEFHRFHSTSKPHNLSLNLTPVKKEENTLNSLDCSFDVNLKSIDVDKSAAESKWMTFGKPFERRNGSCVSSSTHDPEEDADAFVPSVFVGLDRTDTVKTSGDANIANALIRQLEKRLASLERIVHGMEHNANTMRVSDSTHSDQSPHDRAQDIAFIIEGTEILQNSSVREEITCTDWSEDSHRKSKSSKFSVKRMFISRFFGNNGGTKSSLAEARRT